MDRFSEMEVFAKIAEEASLTRAAELLNLSVSGVSRHLSSLESRLGVRLVQRTTRQLSLTSEGERFALSAREILMALNEAETSVSAVTVEPRGTLRIGASLSFALLHLMPVIEAFRARYPQVRIDLQASNRYCDLVENSLDLAVRTRRVEADSSVTIRKLAEVPRLLAASPGYIARHGMPQSPDDLARHQMLLYTLADDWDHLTFTASTGGNEARRLPVSAAMMSNDGQLLRRAALGDMGILVQPAYIVHEDIAAGRLVPLLPGWNLAKLTMNVAFPSRSHLPARTRLFVEALVAYFRDRDLESSWSNACRTA